jgi:hypothetical protein
MRYWTNNVAQPCQCFGLSWIGLIGGSCWHRRCWVHMDCIISTCADDFLIRPTLHLSGRSSAMASLTLDGLQSLLRSVGVSEPIPESVRHCSLNDLNEVYAAYLGRFVEEHTGGSPGTARACIQWPNELGDMVAILPRLRASGVNSKILAADLAHKARCFENSSPGLTYYSSHRHNCLRSRLKTNTISASCSWKTRCGVCLFLLS